MKKKINKNLINCIHDYVIKKYSKKYAFKTKKQKYKLSTIIEEIIYFLNSGVSYNHYRGPINAKSLNNHVLFFAKNRIFETVYKQLFIKYISKKSYTKLKYQHIDTSFIINKNGKQLLGRNKLFKNKKCYKLSFIVDSNGIPLSIGINRGNEHDVKIGYSNLNNIFEIVKNINPSINPYILGDKIYDTIEFRELCRHYYYKPLIDYNKRKIAGFLDQGLRMVEDTSTFLQRIYLS